MWVRVPPGARVLLAIWQSCKNISTRLGGVKQQISKNQKAMNYPFLFVAALSYLDAAHVSHPPPPSADRID